ncbi:gliding motility-associated C-terminal domain-containing protein [Fulvivirgaceae bacterium PWU5]|uniref:Gliding motility-associated C-terminal domain-containing protein n=1 Tax=Dawidia cretensis TaxID=2782350 RepID=A0AAP2E2D5_9BACT|nr:gliding motility-associated C-terminal domain-containing protein [Dawidia cretensis]MBT1710799.1 gliding motility-associated C-terminal domain-containing protein [Dawidia cretensis]
MRRLLYFITSLICAGTVVSTTRLQAQDIIAQGGTVSAQYDGNPPGELIEKLVDKNTATKYLARQNAPLWVKWKCNTPAAAAQYALTSGNDAQGRDPKDWTFEGSDSGSDNDADWIVLDTRTGEDFKDRGMTKTYTFSNNTNYTYYRLKISALYNPNSTIFQLAEWSLAGSNPPDAPSNVTVVTTGGQEAILTWTDNAATESGFEIERSENGVDFVKVGAVAANATRYTDAGVVAGSTYYYRIRGINAFGGSAYTPPVNITTLGPTGALIDLTDDGGVLTVQFDNDNTDENGLKLIDNNLASKYLIPDDYAVPYWVRYQSTTGGNTLLTKYTLTSGGDAAERDPKNWVLEGSDNGADWTMVDIRTNFLFAARSQTATFVVPTPVQYTYYQIRVTDNNGSTGIPGQITEWELWGVDPNAPPLPQNIAVTALSKRVAEITWEDAAANETGYEIFRSDNGTDFLSIDTAAVDATSFTDTGRKGGLTYYYRIRTLYGTNNATIYSAITAVTMPGQNIAPTLDPIADITTCNASVDHVISLTGITPGEGDEDQQVALSVTIEADGREVFEKVPAVTEIVDGKATLTFKLNPEADAATVIMKVQIKDDGGTGNSGVDTVVYNVKVIFDPLPVAVSLDTNLPLARGTTIQLKATGAEQYIWEEGPGIIAGSSTDELTVRPTQGYTYVVTGSNAEGCERDASFFVGIEGTYALDPTNILTPDQDGKNDTWVVWNIHIFPGNQVSVYDRAGKQVFNMEDYTNDWTGTYQGSPLANGVYYYVVEPGAGIKPLKGSLTIIRYDK